MPSPIVQILIWNIWGNVIDWFGAQAERKARQKRLQKLKLVSLTLGCTDDLPHLYQYDFIQEGQARLFAPVLSNRHTSSLFTLQQRRLGLSDVIVWGGDAAYCVFTNQTEEKQLRSETQKEPELQRSRSVDQSLKHARMLSSWPWWVGKVFWFESCLF